MWLTSAAGQERVRAELEARISAAIPGSVRIGGLDPWSGSARDLELLDPAGQRIARADRVTVGWADPLELRIDGFDVQLVVGRDGAVNLRDAVGELPSLGGRWTAHVVATGRADVDLGGFTSSVEDISLETFAVTAPWEVTGLALDGRAVTDLGVFPVHAEGEGTWAEALVAGGTLTVDGEPFDVRAHLEDVFRGGIADVRVSGAQPLPTPLVGDVQVELGLLGTWDRLQVDVDLDGDVRASLTGAVQLSDPDWPWSSEGSLAFGRVWTALPEGFAVDGRVDASGRLRADGTGRLRADEPATAQFTGSVDALGLRFPDGQATVVASTAGVRAAPFTLAGRHRVAGSLGLDAAGVPSGQITLRMALDDARTLGLPAGVEGALHADLTVGDGVVAGPVRLADVSWRGLQVPAAAGRYDGTFDLAGALAGGVTLQAPEVVGPGSTLRDVLAPVRIAWAPGARLRADGRFTASRAEIGALPLESLRGSGSLRGETLDGAITADSPWGAVAGAGQGALGSGAFDLRDVTWTPRRGPAWSQTGPGRARLTPTGLTDVALTLAGSPGSLAVAGALGGPADVLTLDGAVGLGVFTDWLPGSPPLDGQGRLTGALSLTAEGPALDGQLTATGLGVDGLGLGAFEGEVTLRGVDGGLTGVWTVFDQPVQVAARAQLDPAEGLRVDAPWAAALSTDGLLTGRVDLTGTPAHPAWSGRGLVRWEEQVLGQAVLAGSGDVLELSGRLWDGRARVEGRVDTGLSAVLAGSPRPVQGRLTASADVPAEVLFGPDAPVTGALTAHGEVRLDGWTLTPSARAAFQGAVDGVEVRGDAVLEGLSGHGALSVGDGRLTLDASVPTADVRDLVNGRLALVGEGVPLGLVSAFVPDLVDATGALDLDLRVDRQGPQGWIALADGGLRHRFLGIALADLDVRGEVAGRALSLTATSLTRPARERVRERRDGRIALELAGTVGSWDVVDLRGGLTVDDALLLSRPGQRVRLSSVGPVALGGSARHPSVSGVLRVDAAELALDRALLAEADLWPGTPRTLDPRVRLLRDGMDVPRPSSSDRPIWAAWNADLEVQLGSQAEGSMALPYLSELGRALAEASRVRLDGRVFGTLGVTVADGVPRVDGTLEVARGTAQVASSVFGVDRAQVRFVDGDPYRPYLLAQGAMVFDDGASVEMFVRGTPDDAQIAFSSVQLPTQDAVWTAVLTGRNPASVRSNVALTTSLGTSLLGRTLLDRLHLGRWQYVAGGLQARFRLGPRWTLAQRIAPFSMREDPVLLVTEFAPQPRVRLSLGFGTVDRWLGAAWQHRY